MYVALYSSNYHPAHAQHMHAYALALQSCGLSVCIWANEAYRTNHPELRQFLWMEQDSSAARNAPKCKLAIVLNMGLKNIPRTILWRMSGWKVLFCVHEPIRNMADFQNLGLSKREMAKLRAMRALIWLQIRLSTALIAYSRKTVMELAGIKPVVQHPLLYVDQITEAEPLINAPNAISYIGTIAKDHAFAEFLAFVEHCLESQLFPDQRFVIATRSTFDPNHFAAWGAAAAGRVTVQSGRLLSDKEINGFYAEAAVIWCAYRRSNQSGVLPKAYMFGVPVIVSRSLTNLIVADDHFHATELGAEIKSYALNDIALAVQSILADRPRLSKACRTCYLETFDYKANIPTLKKMVNAYE